MTIDDELLLEIIKPDRNGKVSKGALITKMLGEEPSRISYNLEISRFFETPHFIEVENSVINEGTESVRITPDIVVRLHDIGGKYSEIAFELENDIHWDFQESLRQVKKYKAKYEDTRVIIPEDYERYAPLYKNEGFSVYLWKAKRKWQCKRCEAFTEKEGPTAPKCSNQKCKNNKSDDFRLVGLKDTEIEPYP